MQIKKGKLNQITDVMGVLVGQIEKIGPRGQSSGVTAILPSKKIGAEIFEAAVFALNGAGELTASHQIKEWGLIESPIVLTNTASVGIAYEATLKWLSKKFPQSGKSWPVFIPTVGECDDSKLHDFRRFPLNEKDVFKSLDSASRKVRQGSVGGGAGLVTCGYKSGAGTSSRVISCDEGTFSLGTFVHSNWGRSADLRSPTMADFSALKQSKIAKNLPVQEGSLIGVIAVDAPLSTHELERLCRRASLGMARVGSTARHGSGEIFLAFSTHQSLKRSQLRAKISKPLSESSINALFEACIDSIEESIWNSLKFAGPSRTLKGEVVPAFEQT